jgi:hypothetical protein
MQSTISPTELAQLIATIAGPDDTAYVTYHALSRMWRGAYGPFVVVSGRFERGGDFEFAIRLDRDPIDLRRLEGRRDGRELYFVD